MSEISTKASLKFTPEVVWVPLAFALFIWVVFWFELKFGFNFTPYGVLPRTASGFSGILFSPFIHSDLSHLWHNTVPAVVLTGGLFYFYREVAWKVLIIIILGAGLGTWVIGREAYHIGASGVIYGLAAFLFFKGIWSKNFRLTAFSLIVVFLYGGLIWGTMPLQEGMSWEGHLSGFFTGTILAFVIKSKIAKPVKYVWESESFKENEDPFLRQFDANGNFIDPVNDSEEDEEDKSEN